MLAQSGALLDTTVSSFAGNDRHACRSGVSRCIQCGITIGNSGYDQTMGINRGRDDFALSFAPPLTQTENCRSGRNCHRLSNDPRIIGNNYVSSQTSNPGLSYDLYDINMNYLNTPVTFWQQGSHNDQNIDPANGHPTIYSGAGAASGINSCGFVNGVEKIDMITSTKVCLQAPVSFNLSHTTVRPPMGYGSLSSRQILS